MDQDAYFWVVGGGLLQVPMIEQAKAMGYKVIVTDQDYKAPGIDLADIQLILDTYDTKEHVRLAQWLQHKNTLIAGVATCGADVAYTVAHVARELDLPGLDPNMTRVMRDKAAVRYTLAEKWGIYQPEYLVMACEGLFRRPGDVSLAKTLAMKLNYPCVMKPTMQRASRGVTLLDGPEDIPAAIERIRPYATEGQVLLEERLFGTEHSAELIFVQAQKPCFFNIVDRMFTYENGVAMEIGHVNPTKLTTDQQIRIKNMMMAAAQALGVTWGPFKCDIIYAETGPKILEVCARLSGGFDCQVTTPLSQGRNPIRAVIELATGKSPSAESLTMTRVMHAACAAAFPSPGTIKDIPRSGENPGSDLTSYENALIQPGIEQVYITVEPDDVIEPYEHNAQRPAFVIALADEYDVAWQQATTAAKFLAEGFVMEETS